MDLYAEHEKEQEEGEKIMDVAKRNQFIARLSRALGRDQEMCPAFCRRL